MIIAGNSPLPGFEEPDAHDAAYALDNSGTTGNPKGVLHGYGSLQREWGCRQCCS